MEKTPSTGIWNGLSSFRSGTGMCASTAAMSFRMAAAPSSGFSLFIAHRAEPRMTGMLSPSNLPRGQVGRGAGEGRGAASASRSCRRQTCHAAARGGTVWASRSDPVRPATLRAARAHSGGKGVGSGAQDGQDIGEGWEDIG
eukprot:288430-Chlamydomonas_euryale.AAC.1